MYKCDKWIILEIKENDKKIYKLFASFYGGYLTGDSWRINSGIESITMENDVYYFNGYSGSCYVGNKNGYGTIPFTESVLNEILNKSNDRIEISVLKKDTNWLNLI